MKKLFDNGGIIKYNDSRVKDHEINDRMMVCSMEQLKDKLTAYSESGIYPFHMPGHKRYTEGMPDWNLWQIDMTEVEGTDNLHHAEGILKEAMERAAGLTGADRSYFLINGSTGGILSAIACCVKPGDTVLVARNCHKSVYHAIFLHQLKAVYIQPEWIEEYHMSGGIEPRRVEQLLEEYPQIRAVVLTSPTYEGMVSDIGRIAELAHKRGIPLIVDEAHGAHFNGKEKWFPVSAVRKGADIVIQSTHKTLPALTQTGMLHLKGSLVNRERLEQFLAIYQTSSPSYVLMASIDYAVAFLDKEREAMDAYGKRLLQVREEIGRLAHIAIPGRELVGKSAVYDVDNSKLILKPCGKNHDGEMMTGKELYEKLRLTYGLQCEMALESYALAMTSVMDTEEGYDRLLRALKEIDGELEWNAEQNTEQKVRAAAEEMSQKQTMQAELSAGKSADKSCEAVLTIADAFYAEKEPCLREQAAGRISGEYLYLYPPGAPFLVPGERISEELPARITQLEKQGFEIQGLSDETKTTILVIKEEK